MYDGQQLAGGTFRRLLNIASRIGRPGTLLSLGDSGGRLLYLEAAMQPVSVVVALEADDVRELAAACTEWLADHDRAHRPFTRPTPAPLVAGALSRSYLNAQGSTVQLRTV